MITEVRYELLYNLGNFETAKYGATSTVLDGNSEAAFAEARAAVEAQHALFLAEREAEQQRQRAEWDQQAAEQAALIRRQYAERQADTMEADDEDEDLPL